MDARSLPESFISMEEMYHAYRKAKADTFYERSQLCAVDFVNFENNLTNNLEELRKTLTRPVPKVTRKGKQPLAWYEDIAFIGRYAFIPKGLKPVDPERKNGRPTDSLVYSDPWDQWKAKHNQAQKCFKAEFRAVAHMKVEMLVICALWINLVGEKFDRCLDACCRGSRLRRIKSPQKPSVSDLSDDDPNPGVYHKDAVGSFSPYFECYRQWRDEGFRAINAELDAGRRVVAVTMDLAKFYHRVDPSFLLDQRFLDSCRFELRNGQALSENEALFTKQIIAAIETWGKSLPTYETDQPIGLPVGTSVASVIANVLLVEFDRLVCEKLSPVYYARYVDDIFLVLRDSDRLLSREDLVNKLCSEIEPLSRDDSQQEEVLRLRLPYAEKSVLEFRGDKQRVFILRGDMGRDFVETIRSRVDEVSSEWRLMPDLEDISRSPAARVLTANRTPSEDADALRKADSLSLRRLGFASLLRSMDAAARDLPPSEWREQRQTRYEFACRHIVTPLRLFDFESYLARLISIAVECRDWHWAKKMVAQLEVTVDELENKVVAEAENSQLLWGGFRRHLRKSLEIAVYRSMSWSSDDDVRAIELISAIDRLQPGADDMDEWFEKLRLGNPSTSARTLWACDLGKRPFKESLLQYDEGASEKLQSLSTPEASPVWPEENSKRAEAVKVIVSEFAARLPLFKKELFFRPLLYPTRPLTPAEVSDCLPILSEDATQFASTVRALRGTFVKVNGIVNVGATAATDTSLARIVIGKGHSKQATRVAVTSWSVDEKSWSAAAAGQPDLSSTRYQRLVALANSITRTPWKDKPRYVVFPELSIPRRWLPGLAQHFLRQEISLIAGAEYRAAGNGSAEVINEAKLFLTDNRLGYTHGCVVTQQKGLPAHGERDNLRQMFGLSFADHKSPTCQKRIYSHFGFDFGLLVCSELTNIGLRSKFRGQVDALFVLAWNRDLDSFASLVESTALDVHCYVILSNNRKYGDSRVRTPCIQNWRRDLVRLKGGLEDYFVVTEIDIHALREFQSHHEPPTGDEATFKPFPEGFDLSPFRRTIPRTTQTE